MAVLQPTPHSVTLKRTTTMANLTKREIVQEIYRKSGFPQKQIVDTVQQTLDIIQRALSEGRNVELRNFGVLEVQLRRQRIGRNPNKPTDTVIIPQRAVVKFKSGKILKQQLQKIDLKTLERAGRVERAEDDTEAPDDGHGVDEHPLRRNAETPASQSAPKTA
jgi:nucleoid DNA-binding protein